MDNVNPDYSKRAPNSRDSWLAQPSHTRVRWWHARDRREMMETL